MRVIRTLHDCDRFTPEADSDYEDDMDDEEIDPPPVNPEKIPWQVTDRQLDYIRSCVLNSNQLHPDDTKDTQLKLVEMKKKYDISSKSQWPICDPRCEQKMDAAVEAETNVIYGEDTMTPLQKVR